MIHCIKHSEMHEKLKIKKWINLKKMIFFSEKIKKNHNIIIEIKSAFLISVDLKIEKTWLVNW